MPGNGRSALVPAGSASIADGRSVSVAAGQEIRKLPLGKFSGLCPVTKPLQSLQGRISTGSSGRVVCIDLPAGSGVEQPLDGQQSGEDELPLLAGSRGSQIFPKAAGGEMEVRRRSAMRDLSPKAATGQKPTSPLTKESPISVNGLMADAAHLCVCRP